MSSIFDTERSAAVAGGGLIPVHECHDVAIVGAGPAGAALATRLVDAGRSVVLLEAGSFDTARVGESLAPAVQPLLQDIGLWDCVQSLEPLPSWGTKSLWGDTSVEVHSHMFGPYGQGWHVDRRAFDEALALAARERGASLLCSTRVVDVDYGIEGWRIATEDGRTLRSSVLIDGTGRSGVMSRNLGATRLVFDHLVGVGRIWRNAELGHNHVIVEATPDGWWYSAPIPDSGRITLLMTDADVCRQRRLTDTDLWLRALNKTELTGDAVAGAEPETRIRSHAAFSARTVRNDDRPWLSIGDAALAVDPLTGGGVVRALRTAEAAARSCLDLLHVRLDLQPSVIDRYENDRNRECDDYLNERLDFYCAGPAFDSPFWSRRREVAELRDRARERSRHLASATASS